MVVPTESAVEMAVLKGIAAHYVMRADDRVSVMVRQRELLAELVEQLVARGATPSTARSPTTGRPPPTTRRGGGWWSTRSRRSPTPAPLAWHDRLA